jgi:sterol desaturase/sphingolipid hydroxylase (fatty acid hydroxylase superfamily)
MEILNMLVKYKLPVLMVISAIEFGVLVLVLRKALDFKAVGVTLFEVVVRNVVIRPLVPLSIGFPLAYLAAKHNIGVVPHNPVLAFILLFLVQDHANYWAHRATHRIRWMWANHAVHHSSNELNMFAAWRVGLTTKLSAEAFAVIPALWLGFPLSFVGAVLAITFASHLWVHTTWIPKLGWLEYVFLTPSHHRVHHSSNLEYLDANYGAVLIIWDRLFGTFIEERDNVPCRYGLVKPITSHNPLYIEFHEWIAMFRDLSKARSLREWFGYTMLPPGWRPDGDHLTTEALRRAAASAQLEAAE